jgi:hypothetical protein
MRGDQVKWLLNALVILLASASPATAAAPERPQAQACDEAFAPWRIQREVTIGALPVGRVEVWSCSSWQDALDQAAAGEAEIQQTSCERYGTCPWVEGT